MKVTTFEMVSDMNVAFGNKKGNYHALETTRCLAQALNILDEFAELMVGFGIDEHVIKAEVAMMKQTIMFQNITRAIDRKQLRDAACDIQVFAAGLQHFMGVDGDADMRAVIAGVMTRFIKDEQDLIATQKKHAAKGVTDVYFEGEFPKMIMKSGSDQPDAPTGKFLKSASYQDTVFPEIE